LAVLVTVSEKLCEYQLAHGSLGELHDFRMMKLQMGLQNLAKQAGDLVFAHGPA